jgi:CBS domain-containing protein
MNQNTAFCTPEVSLEEASRIMMEKNCGALPVVDGAQSRKVVGIMTDRDIVCRCLAHGKDYKQARTESCMSSLVVAVRPDDDLETCCELMAENRIRRLPVVDDEGRLVGLVTQSHIARYGNDRQIAEVLRKVSEKTETPSTVGAAM